MLENYWHKLPQIRSNGLFRYLGIGQKIGCGYAIAIGIAIVGTTGGLIAEKYFKGQAKEQLVRVHQQAYLVQYFQDAVLQVNSYNQQLLFLAGLPDNYPNKSEQVLEEIKEVNLKLARLYGEITEARLSDRAETPTDVEIEALMQEYKEIVETYSQRLSEFFKPIYQYPLSPQEVEQVKRSLLEFTNTELSYQFNNIARSLSQLSKNLHEEQQKEFIEYQQAENLGQLILIISLLLSVAMAAAMVIYTSYAIARPLAFTTAVTKRITETGNFKLVAPVTTNDEVGQLANSLNELIQKIAAYTEDVKNTQAQLIHREKMSSLGQMVAGIAHEINNPVNFISGNVAYLENYLQDLLNLIKIYQERYPELMTEMDGDIQGIDLEFIAEDLPKILISLKKGAERIREMVVSLRNFSRLDESEVKRVDLHQGIDSTLVILNNRMKGAIAIIRQYDKLPSIECYPAQLNQVFLHIIENAIDALLSSPYQENKQIAIQTEKVSLNSITIRIRDNGCGIPPEINNKIFDPFFTTKPVGQGTGLGLSISYKIIEKHQGKIQFSSQMGQGTEFIISLPIQQTLSPAVFAA